MPPCAVHVFCSTADRFVKPQSTHMLLWGHAQVSKKFSQLKIFIVLWHLKWENVFSYCMPQEFPWSRIPRACLQIPARVILLLCPDLGTMSASPCSSPPLAAGATTHPTIADPVPKMMSVYSFRSPFSYPAVSGLVISSTHPNDPNTYLHKTSACPFAVRKGKTIRPIFSEIGT